MEFEPTLESLSRHETPAWFRDARFGIFIHWGLYSVPAFASGLDALDDSDPMSGFKNNPYAEWYLN